jgi:hypothetical protein
MQRHRPPGRRDVRREARDGCDGRDGGGGGGGDRYREWEARATAEHGRGWQAALESSGVEEDAGGAGRKVKLSSFLFCLEGVSRIPPNREGA